MMLYLDAAGSFWREWVVNYDSTHQRTLGERTAQNGRALFDSSQLWLKLRYERLLTLIRRTRNHIMHASGVWVGAGLLLIFASFILLALCVIIHSGGIALILRQMRLNPPARTSQPWKVALVIVQIAAGALFQASSHEDHQAI